MEKSLEQIQKNEYSILLEHFHRPHYMVYASNLRKALIALLYQVYWPKSFRTHWRRIKADLNLLSVRQYCSMHNVTMDVTNWVFQRHSKKNSFSTKIFAKYARTSIHSNKQCFSNQWLKINRVATYFIISRIKELFFFWFRA